MEPCLPGRFRECALRTPFPLALSEALDPARLKKLPLFLSGSRSYSRFGFKRPRISSVVAVAAWALPCAAPLSDVFTEQWKTSLGTWKLLFTTVYIDICPCA